MDMVDKTKTMIFQGKTRFSGGKRNSSFGIRDPSLTHFPLITSGLMFSVESYINEALVIQMYEEIDKQNFEFAINLYAPDARIYGAGGFDRIFMTVIILFKSISSLKRH
jgi:hypothetical protein